MQEALVFPNLETLQLPPAEVHRIVAAAVAEDLGWGDITTDNLVPAKAMARAEVVFRSGGVVCGIGVLAEVFRCIDEAVAVEALVAEGTQVGPGAVVAVVQGPARGVLKGERVALNFVQRMAAIATATARYVKEAEGFPAHIIDTRKTTPGLRLLERYAIRVGGGYNHRFNLSDGVLVKDNHLVAMRGEGINTVDALRLLRTRIPHTARIEVEVDRLDQIPEMLESGVVDCILLDNMTPDEVRKAVQMIRGRAATEVSGGVRLETVRAYAEAGVDVISAGALTHSTPALDVGLDFELE